MHRRAHAGASRLRSSSRLQASRVAEGVAKTASSVRLSGLPTEGRLFIDGEFVESSALETFKTHDPATGDLIATVQQANEEDVNKAVAAAKRAFPNWSQADGRFRRDCLYRLADLMERHIDELAEMESRDSGKPITEAKTVDLPLAIEAIRYYAGWADKIQGDTIPLSNHHSTLAYSTREPVGVCGQLIPWNFPLLMFSWKTGPAMATGCTTVMKASQKTPVTAAMLGHLIKEAGFPPGVINILQGPGRVIGDTLINHPDVAKIAYTGSTAQGRRIMRACAEAGMKRVSLELGGKSPLIVLDDADLDQAVKAACQGCFSNMGQCCIASTRIYVQAGVYDEFLRRVGECAAARTIGSPLDAATVHGPQIGEKQIETILAYVEGAHKDGARLICGGKKTSVDGKGHYFEPTVFADVSDDMAISEEEIFGPVMSVHKFKTVDEAVERANASQYGLGAGVCTRDVGKAHSIARRLQAGTVYINTWNQLDAAAPFGGFKQSGQHRELGEAGLEPYTELKTVVADISYRSEQ
ncbi:unnamed protein product [Vitrella brassicaformis CCMP3155]|uniref:Aldehyde dehydrogenase domain-containing protein n=2 Tax=Vitrella brassicaformis TaxID=1169539 RepID=A0A0G4GKF8_VITBC|nr:unnamed protein product [Vitrella brassicaformis CCMP3155]|eukprot:CEM30451.1 unnamed protein product [Vitrella brassicaformis CCMP3155]